MSKLSFVRFTLLTLVVVPLVACGDDGDSAGSGGSGASAGTGGGSGSSGNGGSGGSAASGGASGAAGAAGASGSAGSAGSGGGSPRSQVLAYVGSSVYAIDAVDAAGKELVFDNAFAWNAPSAGAQGLYATVGSKLYRLKVANPSHFEEIGEMTDGTSPKSPDLMASNAIGASGEVIAGLFGADLQLFDLQTMQFGAPWNLRDTNDQAFDPRALVTVDLGSGLLLVALRENSDAIWALESSSNKFINALVPTACSGGVLTGIDHLMDQKVGNTRTATVIVDSKSYTFDTTSFCFQGPNDLEYQNAPVVPEIALGFDYDGMNDDELVLIRTVTP